MNEELNEYLKLLGARVRSLRTAARLSQQKLADATHIDRGFISGIEHGRHNMSLEIAAKLAAVFNLRLEDFLCGNFERIPEEQCST